MSGGFCALSSGVTMDEPATRHGVYVTAAYILVLYGRVKGKARTMFKLAASYKLTAKGRVTPLRCHRADACLCV